jgi:hypothetical protein
MGKEYTRLPGRRLLSAWGTDSLWLGKDHVLSIKKRGYVEEYRRFYFRDIQAILMNQTNEGMVWNLLLGSSFAILLFFLFLAWRVWEWELGGLIAWSILTGLFLMGFLFNMIRGPICNCSLRTAVQVDRLPSLHRVRSALKMIRIIQPHIEAAQGTMSREQLFSLPLEFSAPAAVDFQEKGAEIQGIHHESGRFHFALFGFLIANAFFTLLDLFYRNASLYVIGLVIVTCILVSIIGAAVRQRNSDMNSALKRTVWFSFGLLIAIALGGYVDFFLYLLRYPRAVFNQWGIMQGMMKTSPMESTFSIIFHIFCIFGSVLVGVTGMILLLQHRNVGLRNRIHSEQDQMTRISGKHNE